jgi:hypothetical protein
MTHTRETIAAIKTGKKFQSNPAGVTFMLMPLIRIGSIDTPGEKPVSTAPLLRANIKATRTVKENIDKIARVSRFACHGRFAYRYSL